MKGHIRERSAGHWAIVLDARDPETGKRKRRWHSFAGTKRQAQIEAPALSPSYRAAPTSTPPGLRSRPSLTAGSSTCGAQVTPRRTSAIRTCRKNLMPLLGGFTLIKLQPAHYLTGLRQSARQRPQGRPGRAYRPTRSTTCTEYLRQALQQAVRWQLLARNPLTRSSRRGSSARK